jgi:hypothetical protein
MDMSGKLVNDQYGVSVEGTNRVELQLENLKSGIYVVILMSDNSQMQQRLFVE